MGGKKQPGRFTIQFNAADPQQRQVIELLNQQGRGKAVFLTCAVLAYCGQATPAAFQPPVLESALVEQMVQKVLQEKAAATPVPDVDDKQPTAMERTSSKEIKEQKSLAIPGTVLPLGDSDLRDSDLTAICDTIDAFRQP